MEFRILIHHVPYTGPPTPGTVHEWTAICVDPIPQITTYYGKLELVSVRASGQTREEAIEALRRVIREHLSYVERSGTIEQATISI